MEKLLKAFNSQQTSMDLRSAWDTFRVFNPDLEKIGTEDREMDAISVYGLWKFRMENMSESGIEVYGCKSSIENLKGRIGMVLIHVLTAKNHYAVAVTDVDKSKVYCFFYIESDNTSQNQ